jgi:TonB-linked SusC/RagA family outer membrane protein
MKELRSYVPRFLVLALALGMGLIGAFPAAAQNVTGRVQDAGNLQPLSGTQVSISALGVETITNQSGRFLFGVAAGTHQVRFESLGYGTVTETITVDAGQNFELNVSLRQEALALDEIVVTGTAGGTQRRAIGNVVETVNAAAIMEVAPVTNVQNLLGQRTAGLIVLPSAGQVGTGSPIRIRGVTSMGLSNDPIIFIDGVRMDASPTAGPSTRGGRRISRINDLTPEDIESIEIIKGPSAATLYGTEASNGVIQIITKRGRPGKPQFDVTIRSGQNWLQNPEGRAGGDPDGLNGMNWRADPITGELQGFNLLEEEVKRGNPAIFSTGLQQGYNISLRGGTEAIRYYTSVSVDDDEGILGYDFAKRFNARANLDLVLAESLSLKTSTGYMQSRIRLAQNSGGFGAEPFSNIIWGSPRTLDEPRRGFMSAPPEEWGKHETHGDNDRITTSMELAWNPIDWTSHRLSIGMDRGEANDWILIPRQPEGRSHFWGARALGEKRIVKTTNRFITVDYAGSAHYDFRPNLRFTSSVGVQYYGRQMSSIEARGSDFPAVPITTVSGGADRMAFENFTENVTVGAYVQEQLDWNNRIFVTAALRADKNSAFGAEYGAAYYPKLSGTWVISESDFWNVDWIDQFRLRSAWGAAGQQPGTFDASRLYDPGVGFNDQPGLVPGSFGNPQLKPERSEELEYGADVSLFGGRVDLVFSRYSRTIKDAIVNRPVPTSTGFSGSQVVNLAEVTAGGNELGITLRVVQGSSFGWDVSTQFATMDSKVQDLGGLAFVPAGKQQANYEGYPIGGFFAKRVREATIDAAGIVLTANCDGGAGFGNIDSGGALVPCSGAPDVFWGTSAPTWQLGMTNTFTFGDNFRIYARVEGNGGHWNFNSELRAAHNVQVTKARLCRCDPLVQATRQYENNTMGFHEGGYLRLREVGASLTLPSSLLESVGASRGVISISGRNLAMLWTKSLGWGTYRDGRVLPPNNFGGRWSWDAELRSTSNVRTDQQTMLPPFASFTATVRLSF